jgi:hypothetical protein
VPKGGSRDVIDREGEARKSLRQKAIFATVARSTADQLFQRIIHLILRRWMMLLE